MKTFKAGSLAAALLATISFASAHADSGTTSNSASRADSHGPIGVMGEHMHKTGEWMLSYRFMHMGMAGSRINGNSVSADFIATTTPNRFFGMPMQPPTLRVVPLRMDMDMHMFGGMYAPTDWLTLMAMGMYVTKEMDHVTYQGPAGTTELGEFTTKANGIGDTTLTGLIRLYETDSVHIHAHAGIGLPTGSNSETDDVLTPMNTNPILRLPYPMQIGSGTYDLRPGFTYSGKSGDLGWGLQYTSIIRLGRDQGYRLGDVHQFTGWASYQIEPWMSVSARLAGDVTGRVHGIDSSIVAPVQTANPLYSGGETITTFLGANFAGQQGLIRGHRLGLEIGVPVMRHLNGPQMETDWQITVGWQKSF